MVKGKRKGARTRQGAEEMETREASCFTCEIKKREESPSEGSSGRGEKGEGG